MLDIGALDILVPFLLVIAVPVVALLVTRRGRTRGTVDPRIGRTYPGDGRKSAQETNGGTYT